MPLVRKRRQDPDAGSPSRRRRTDATNDTSEASNSSDNENYNDPDASPPPLNSTSGMVKKLVRLALASEYSRQPIRRNDIGQKVLGENNARQFKPVFTEAQKVLRDRFGMQMVEAPLKEKVTISQRRAAQRAEKPSTTSKSWTVTTILPPAYRIPTILTPARAPSTTTEATHTALYSFIITLLTLSGGSLPEQKLDRYLRRVNAESYTPLDRTDRYLARLCKEGYLVRQRDVDGGEEVVDYYVGPRGKVEVGTAGVSGLVREVYGFGLHGDGNSNREKADEFEGKLRRSLGIRESAQQRDDDDDNDTQGNGAGRSAPRRSRRGIDESDDD